MNIMEYVYVTRQNIDYQMRIFFKKLWNPTNCCWLMKKHSSIYPIYFYLINYVESQNMLCSFRGANTCLIRALNYSNSLLLWLIINLFIFSSILCVVYYIQNFLVLFFLLLTYCSLLIFTIFCLKFKHGNYHINVSIDRHFIKF